MTLDLTLDPSASSALVRPAPETHEGVFEHGLRLAWINGLMNARWVFSTDSRTSGMRYCPQCLRDHPIWRSDWRTSGQIYCQKHLDWLRDSCHVCGSLLALPRTRLLSCACQADLRAAPTLPLSPSLRVCAQLKHPPSDEVLAWLAAWSTHGPRGRPLKKASITKPSERTKLLEAGADIVLDWPRAWHDAMRRHRSPIEAGRVQRLCDAWPGLPLQIKRLGDAAWREKVWSAVDGFSAASHTTSRPVVGRNPRLMQRPPTQRATARALGIGVLKLRSVIAQSEATKDDAGSQTPVRQTIAGRLRYVVSNDRAESLATALRAHISIRSAAALLGCRGRRVRALVADGVLCVEGDRLLCTEVEFLRTRLLNKTLVAGQESPEEMQPLDRVWQMVVPAPFTSAFLDAVDSGEIRVFASTHAATWHDVCVSTFDAKRWWASSQARKTKTMSLREAAVALGVKEQVAYELADRGLLETSTLRVGRRSARRVSARAIEAFNTAYVALGKLASAAGIHSHVALSWARSLGLEVVSGPAIDGARQYFVKRQGAAAGSAVVRTTTV